MQEFLILLVTFTVSTLTLFSGFGLGTVLMPVLAIFFPITSAIYLTALVHFVNNGFKCLLLGKNIQPIWLIKFGLPAVVAAFPGAWLLNYLSKMDPLLSYTLLGYQFFVTPVKIVIALLLIFFATQNLFSLFQYLKVKPNWIPLGGVLSGFFGGLSGYQGALRSAFLIQSGISKEAFIATGAMIALFVDFTRITYYYLSFEQEILKTHFSLILCMVGAVFLGVLLGKWLLKFVSLPFMQQVIGVSLYLLAILLTTGIF